MELNIVHICFAVTGQPYLKFWSDWWDIRNFYQDYVLNRVPAYRRVALVQFLINLGAQFAKTLSKCAPFYESTKCVSVLLWIAKSYPTKQLFLSLSVCKQCVIFNFALWYWTTMHVEAIYFGATFSRHLQGEWIFTLLGNAGTALPCDSGKPKGRNWT